MALNRDSGEISGTPLEKGDTLIPVQLSVSGFDGTLLGVARVEVATPYSLNYPSAVYGVVGRAYQAAPPTVAGLTAVDTVRYELVTGAMPPGLTLNAQTGLISGTPTAVTVEGFLQVRMTVTRGSMATTAVTFLSYGIQAR